ncbi:Ankyrin repeat-containing protein [Aphelenchoides fujianensis]|nr:Ankyrin repeat-containing protein [Aphelenchoides fujianensis]
MNEAFEYGEACVTSIEPKDFPLHHVVFMNDVQLVRRLLKDPNVEINKRNAAGDTPLHIAVERGYKEITRMLLEAGASVRAKNNDGWSPMVEAISYGDRQTITEMLKMARRQAEDALAERKPHLIRMLNEIDDFYLEFRWDFHSWIPLLSRMLPSDVCRIYKKGCALRMDTSLLSMNDKSWERGDVSFLFNPNLPAERQSVVLDNKRRTFCQLKSNWSSSQVEEEVDVLMSADVVDARMSTKPITFSRARSGWIFRQDRTEEICGYPSDFFEVQNLNLVTKKRREHLTAEDVRKNKSIMNKFTNGHVVDDREMSWSKQRPSLPPPIPPEISFEEYISSVDPIPLGRQPVVKTNTKSYTAMIAMSKEFPLSVNLLVDALEVLAPVKRINKFREFCRSKLPPGFPFDWRDDLTDRMFTIPSTYTEDSVRRFNF